MITKDEFESYCKEHGLRYIFDKDRFIEVLLDKDFDKNIFYCCCIYGYLETIEWLITINKFYFEDDYHRHQSFEFSLEFGHLNVAQWLYDICEKYSSDYGKNYHININCFDDLGYTPFVISCSYGHLEEAKWLYELGNKIGKPINLHVKKDEAFIGSCTNGFLDVAKWLYELSVENNDEICIYRRDEEAFKWSCCFGYLNVVEWLYNLSVKKGRPFKINDELFITCSNHYYKLEVSRWLQKFNKNYYLRVENGVIIEGKVINFYDKIIIDEVSIIQIIKKMRYRIL